MVALVMMVGSYDNYEGVSAMVVDTNDELEAMTMFMENVESNVTAMLGNIKYKDLEYISKEASYIAGSFMNEHNYETGWYISPLPTVKGEW